MTRTRTQRLPAAGPLGPGEALQMRDWRDGQVRYIVHFGDGGSGMRHRDEQLEVGAELREGGERYRVGRVEQPGHARAIGHAWVARIEREYSAVARQPA